VSTGAADAAAASFFGAAFAAAGFAAGLAASFGAAAAGAADSPVLLARAIAKISATLGLPPVPDGFAAGGAAAFGIAFAAGSADWAAGAIFSEGAAPWESALRAAANISATDILLLSTIFSLRVRQSPDATCYRARQGPNPTRSPLAKTGIWPPPDNEQSVESQQVIAI
jgi:hypothetical protein